MASQETLAIVFLILIHWALCAIVCGGAAKSRGRSFLIWFVAALILSPYFIIFAIIAFPNKIATDP